MDEPIPVKSVGTTFEILQAISREGPIRFSDLAAKLDLPKSTVYDHLRSLRRLGYVHETDDGYQVSFEFLLLGDRRRHKTDLFMNARREMEELATETGEHASLVVEEGGTGRAIYTIKGESPVEFKVYDGTQSHLGSTAPGRTILANLPRDRVNAVLDEHGVPEEGPETDREELFSALEDVRDAGYAVDEGSAIHGMNGVGVPIIDRQGTVRGAISVYGPVGRMSPDRMNGDLVGALREKANIIELNLDLTN